MIDIYNVWLPQILRFVSLIREESQLRRCWIEGKCDQTSVTSFDELLEQVFDDLDAESIYENLLKNDSRIDAELLAKIGAFLEALRKAEHWVDQQHTNVNMREVLSSSCWGELKSRCLKF